MTCKKVIRLQHHTNRNASFTNYQGKKDEICRIEVSMGKVGCLGGVNDRPVRVFSLPVPEDGLERCLF